MNRFRLFGIVTIIGSLTPMLLAEVPTPPTPVPAQPTTQPTMTVPSIEGAWLESSGVVVHVTQTGASWMAECSYVNPTAGEVSWEMKGTVTPDGKITGLLKHTKAPKDWTLIQNRNGQLSAKGTAITGTATWRRGGNATFTWTRLVDKPAEISRQDKTVALSSLAYSALVQKVHSEKRELSYEMGAIGYVIGRVVEVLDGSTAIVEIAPADRFNPSRQVIIEGLPTAGVADGQIWPPADWFKIVDTRKMHGTTYFVAWRVVEAR